MKLYNTLGRQLDELKPGKQPLKLYTCGPTVYNYAHIGNLRNVIFNDTLRRALDLNGFEVDHVMNITDVGHLVGDADGSEDKLEKGAEREGKTVWEVAEFYTEAFFIDTGKLNILSPGKIAKATDYIPEQVELVQRLMDRGFVYQTEQAIYFDVTNLKDYGKLSGQSLEQKLTGARDEVITDKAKRHPYDFAVWFFTTGHFADHVMHWASPWGEGFPGWHTECSAIIHATLGEPIDIHTGGIDHIGTHHTNEIAQSEAAYGVELAKLWLHNEFLLVDAKKMSKSLNNLYTLEDLEKKGFDPLAYRLLMLQAHYRSELNFSWKSLTAAQNFLLNLQAWADQRYQPEIAKPLSDKDAKTLETAVTMALADDLDTPKAIAVVGAASALAPAPSAELLKFLDQALGLRLQESQDISDDHKQLLADREKARLAKDFTKSDQLREQLREQGIELDDTPNGPRWRRAASRKESYWSKP